MGEDLALKRGWKVGDHIPLSSHIFSRRNGSSMWDFTIVGLFRARTAGISTNSMMFHHAYLDETRSRQRNTIGWMVLQTTSPSVNDRVAKAIEQMFANSPDETSCDSEKVFHRAFAAQLGNIALIIVLVIGAAFVTILMIVGNTMALTVRERAREIGVLKALGFSRGRILALVLGESVLFALLGGLPGIALAALAAVVLRGRLAACPLAVTPAIALIAVGLMLARPHRRHHSGRECDAAEHRAGAQPGLTDDGTPCSPVNASLTVRGVRRQWGGAIGWEIP